MSMNVTKRDVAVAAGGAVGGIAVWEAAKWAWNKFRGKKEETASSNDSKKKSA